jgi:pantoate--beta-alanine ligase
MEVFEYKAEMHEYSLRHRAEGRSVGLVPTMGALHEGHMALVRKAVDECDAAVVSIFLNPTQFAGGEDYEQYPRTLDEDRRACEEAGVAATFEPAPDEMYLPDADTFVVQERLAGVLEGASRPTHFRGVLTVVLKLFNIVAPHVAYFGQKDYQQGVVVRKMVADLDVPVEIRVAPTVREPDGLAMSSRNRYLDEAERAQAVCVSDALRLCAERFQGGERDTAALKRLMQGRIEREPAARVDYVEIARPETLEPAGRAEAGDVALVAAFVGETRLIDNRVLA